MRSPQNLTTAATSIILVLFSVGTFAFANHEDKFLKGYVVTTKKDTLHGWILLKDHVFNTRTCAFLRSVDGPMESFTPDDRH